MSPKHATTMEHAELNVPFVDAADGWRLDPAEFVVFDNGGLTNDRYTILPYFAQQGLPDATRGLALALSEHPNEPGGEMQWVGMSARAIKNHALDLGHRLAWEELPASVRQHARLCLSEESVPGQPMPGMPARARMG